MTFARFLVLWGLVSLAVSFALGWAIARLRLEGKPCHLVTARQASTRLGVSLAAVQAWERDGLVPTIYCPACGRSAIPIAALLPLAGRPPADLDLVGLPAGASA